jgi:ABC-type antimicrobial peptide transport system permease subunit
LIRRIALALIALAVLGLLGFSLLARDSENTTVPRRRRRFLRAVVPPDE